MNDSGLTDLWIQEENAGSAPPPPAATLEAEAIRLAPAENGGVNLNIYTSPLDFLLPDRKTQCDYATRISLSREQAGELAHLLAWELNCNVISRQEAPARILLFELACQHLLEAIRWTRQTGLQLAERLENRKKRFQETLQRYEAVRAAIRLLKIRIRTAVGTIANRMNAVSRPVTARLNTFIGKMHEAAQQARHKLNGVLDACRNPEELEAPEGLDAFLPEESSFIRSMRIPNAACRFTAPSAPGRESGQKIRRRKSNGLRHMLNRYVHQVRQVEKTAAHPKPGQPLSPRHTGASQVLNPTEGVCLEIRNRSMRLIRPLHENRLELDPQITTWIKANLATRKLLNHMVDQYFSTAECL